LPVLGSYTGNSMSYEAIVFHAENKYGALFCAGSLVALVDLGILQHARLIQGTGWANIIIGLFYRAFDLIASTNRPQSDDCRQKEQDYKKHTENIWQSKHLMKDVMRVFLHNTMEHFAMENQEWKVAKTYMNPATWVTLQTHTERWLLCLKSEDLLGNPSDNMGMITVNSKELVSIPVFSITSYNHKSRQIVCFTNDESSPESFDHTHLRVVPPSPLTQPSLAKLVLGAISPPFVHIATRLPDYRLLQESKLTHIGSCVKHDPYGLALCRAYECKEKPLLIESPCMSYAPSIALAEARNLVGKIITWTHPSLNKTLKSIVTAEVDYCAAENAEALVHIVNWGHALVHKELTSNHHQAYRDLFIGTTDVYHILYDLFGVQTGSTEVEFLGFQEEDEENSHLL
jgi:hypothetical protein